ncbi:MAG: GAF domain-containing protein [Anaerolineae bacterium]
MRHRFGLPSSLFARLLIYFVLLAVIPLITVGAITYYQGQRTLRDNILDHLTTTAILKEEEINRWVGSMEQDVELLAADPTLQQWTTVLLADEGQGVGDSPAEGSDAYESLHAYLDTVLAAKSDFSEIMLLRAVGGEVLVSTNRAQEGSYEVTSSFFTEGRKSTYVQNIYESPSLGELAMTVATPLLAGGETVGVLAVHLDLDQLDAIMQERGGLGQTGETFLMDRFNNFVSQARFGRDAFPRGVHTDGIDFALIDKRDGAGIYNNYREVPVIGAYRWLEGRDMALLAEIELDEAMRPVRALAWTVVLVGLVIAGLVGVVAYAVARQISQPILSMAETSRLMAAGELDQTGALRPTMQRQDEIGVLARSFNGMATRLRGLIDELEKRVADRTRDLERQAVQLATAAEVGRAAASILDLDSLLFRVVDLVRQRFGLYYAGLFLIDEVGDFAVLEAGTGEAGRMMLDADHRLAVGGRSMVGQACSERAARIALDVGEERVRFDNPLLPDTRSEMALPLVVGERVLGALDVQSTEAAAFSQADIDVLQLVADQVAVAVDNARKFSEEAGLLEATNPLYRVSHRLAAATTVDEVSQAILTTVAETEADGCLVAQFDRTPAGEVAGTDFLGRWEREGRPRGLPGQTSIAAAELLPLLSRPSVVEDVTQDEQIPAASRTHLAQLGIRSLVTVPMRVTSSGRVQGFLAIDRQTPGPFSPVSLRLYETLAEQAAVALERARLLEASQQQAWREHHIRDISDRITSSFDLDHLVRTTVEELGMMIGAAGGYVEIAPPTGKVEVEAGNGSGRSSGSGSNGREEEAGT